MSTVKVDTIQTTGGVSEIAIDKLKGVSSASSISVVAEGGTTTTNLQQGLVKAWWQFDQANSNTLRDSLNVSSVNDNSTGNMTATITNDFSSSTNYSAASCLAYQNDSTTHGTFRGNGNIARAAGTLQWTCVYVSSTAGAGTVEDDDENSWQLCGDLA